MRTKRIILITVVCLIVFSAVLAGCGSTVPSYLANVEYSRAARDDSAMEGVCESIMLALDIDDQAFDEFLANAYYGNVSCYVDSNVTKDYIVVTKDGKDGEVSKYLYNDNARSSDKEEWKFAGNMRGLTITFHNNDGKIDIMNGSLNIAIDDSLHRIRLANIEGDADEVSPVEEDGTRASTFCQLAGFFSKVRMLQGDEVEIGSKKYAHSDYTVFINFSCGDGVSAGYKVYGQWNGTNLSK